MTRSRPVARKVTIYDAFGYIADLTGDWHLPFLGSIGLLLLGAALAGTMHPERPFEEA